MPDGLASGLGCLAVVAVVAVHPIDVPGVASPTASWRKGAMVVGRDTPLGVTTDLNSPRNSCILSSKVLKATAKISAPLRASKMPVTNHSSAYRTNAGEKLWIITEP